MDQLNFEQDVHTAHCCKWHGCKYGDWKNNCTVTAGAKQEYPCEQCSWQWEEYLAVKQYDPEWVEYITRWKTDGGQL